MRILAIRGKNLASLAGEFEVDFQKQPLENAGVFAISGPTGSGKSTLLDALCLALYHDTPRLLNARENNVAIPDVGDHTLTPKDPRNLLRRGCVEGHAEVDFVGHDGVPRRATWRVRRAHGKVNGRMQAASAELARLDTGAVEFTATGETRSAIESAIGLSFDQFRRAVLLAQNDFATLLKAGNNERASLLEALTNTGIFSQLSKAAYARHANEQQAVDQLRQQLDVLSTLPPDEREQLDADVATSNALCEQLAQSLKALSDEQHWHVRGQQLQQQCVTAGQDRERQQNALDADRPFQQQLQRWNAIAPLRPLWQNRLGIIRKLQALQAGRPALDEAIGRTRQAEETAKTALAAAQQSLNEARTQHQNAQPILLATRKMDEAIRQQQSGKASQQQALEKTRGEQHTLDEAIHATRQQQRVLQTAVDTWPQWRKDHPALGIDDAAWPAIGEGLRKAHEQHRQTAQARQDITRLEAQQQAAQTALDAATTVASEADAALLAAQAELKTCTEAFDALAPTSLGPRQKALHLKVQQVDRWAVALSALITVQTQHAEAAARLAQLQDKLASDEVAITTARDDAKTADGAATDAHTAFEHASLAADQITRRLREELKPGEPCLVCGALEHPIDAQQTHTPQPGMDDLLATLKQRRDDAQHERDAARARHERATTEFDATKRAVTEANRALEAADVRLQQAGVACRAAACAAEGIDDNASLQDSTTLTNLLHTAQEDLRQQTSQLEHAEAQVGHARQTLEQARELVDQQRGKTEQSHRAQQDAKDHLTPITADLRSRQALLATSKQAQQQTLQHLHQHSGNPALDLSQLDTLLADWNIGEPIRTAAAQAHAPLAASTSTGQAQQQQRQAFATRIADIEQALATLDHELTQARELRQQTLAEPDVETYAQRLQQTEATATDTLAHQRTAFDQTAERHRNAITARQTATQNNDQWQTDLDAAEAQLLDQLHQRPPATEAPLTIEALAPLIDSLPDDLAQRNADWQQREQALRDAATAVNTLNRQLVEWQTEARSTRSADDVATEQAAIAQQQTAATETQAGLRARQLEDQRRHRQSAEHRERIEALTIQVRRWQQLNTLIGSAGGDKFKTYAQQFTLDVLLDYANQHLTRLAPRYQLRRGNEPLTLLIVDGDFADEVRSVHSLSGGESFLVSLALALGLASLSSERVRVESLFIDEGFGSLDADTLNMAMEALDRLQSEGRRVGVISHVHDMAERIGVQIKVRPVAPGKSVVEIEG